MAEETLQDSGSMRRFAGIELGDNRIPDETTIELGFLPFAQTGGHAGGNQLMPDRAVVSQAPSGSAPHA
jgi:hypothetical protein